MGLVGEALQGLGEHVLDDPNRGRQGEIVRGLAGQGNLAARLIGVLDVHRFGGDASPSIQQGEQFRTYAFDVGSWSGQTTPHECPFVGLEGLFAYSSQSKPIFPSASALSAGADLKPWSAAEAVFAL